MKKNKGKPSIVKKEILVSQISKDKQDNVWYDGQDIAVIEKGDRRIVITAQGQIRINIYDENGNHLDTLYNRTIGDLAKYGIHNDMDIDHFESKDMFEWANNGWFEMCCQHKGKSIDLMLDVAYNYADAIAYAEKMIKKDQIWKRFER